MKFINVLLRQIVKKKPETDVDLSMKQVSPKVLHTRLKKGVVVFMFEKKNGTMRIAQGTLQMDRVPPEYHPQGIKEPTPLQINYFDTVKNQWRSMSSNTRIYLG